MPVLVRLERQQVPLELEPPYPAYGISSTAKARQARQTG
jgi:hypothetical protein